MNRPVEVYVLVDWNSQLHAYNQQNSDEASVEVARNMLGNVCRDVSLALRKVSSNTQSFRVRMRLYHGWHSGHSPRPRRGAIQQATAPIGENGAGFPDFATHPGIAMTGWDFGDRLLYALDCRVDPQTSCHLPGTYIAKRNEEKMVDTGLAADLLYLAAHGDEWLMVVGQDRDLVPPIFVAEAMLAGTDRQIMLLARNRIKMLKLEGLLC